MLVVRPGISSAIRYGVRPNGSTFTSFAAIFALLWMAVTAGGVGVTKVSATGDVYFLEKLEDFPGTYSAVTIGAAVVGGAGASQYENNKGVFVSVKSKTEGVGLNLGLGAVQVAFAK